MPKELLIKGGYVVTVDPDLGDLPAGDVLVADGLITAVGPDLEPTTTAAEVIEAAGRLVIPGMVDTHRHVWQGAIGGYTPQITGAGYGPAVLTGISLKYSPKTCTQAQCGAPCRPWTRASPRSPTGRTTTSPGTRRRGPARPAGLRDPRLLPLRRTWSGHRRSQSAAPGGRPPHA
jgi:hypothetical protein